LALRKRILRFIDNDGTTYFTNLSKKQLESTISILFDTEKIIEIKAI